MNAKAPLCVQIAALGGQGGGVLAEWLGEAARHGGYPAQVTSIPGVAQRTGATTYYFEMYPQADCPQKPVFCLSPDADGLDLMVAMEPLEAVRALELGLITKRTVVISAISRIYSTAEKTVAGNGAIDTDILFAALEGAAKAVVRLDLAALSGKPGSPGNAAMFGAIAGTALLPLSKQDFQQAIHIKGVAVDASLKEFATGFNYLKSADQTDASVNEILHYDDAPASLQKEITALPAPLRALAGHACATLIDFQDEKYARLFLERIVPLQEAADDLVLEVATRLASWMAYEDVIRVAQLKTRPGRLARIRAEVGIDESAPLSVIEFLKPGREELASLMPPSVGRMLMKGHSTKSTSGLPLRLPTSNALGYASLKALAGLRRWRPRTYRFEREQLAIKGWLASVTEATSSDPELALATARLAVLARGYGGVRARGLEKLDELFANWSHKLKDDPASLSAAVDKTLDQARNDPDKECGTIN